MSKNLFVLFLRHFKYKVFSRRKKFYGIFFYFELGVRFELTYHGFADRDFTYQTPELELAAVIICRSCCYLIVRFYIYLIS